MPILTRLNSWCRDDGSMTAIPGGRRNCPFCGGAAFPGADPGRHRRPPNPRCRTSASRGRAAPIPPKGSCRSSVSGERPAPPSPDRFRPVPSTGSASRESATAPPGGRSPKSPHCAASPHILPGISQSDDQFHQRRAALKARPFLLPPRIFDGRSPVKSQVSRQSLPSLAPAGPARLP